MWYSNMCNPRAFWHAFVWLMAWFVPVIYVYWTVCNTTMHKNK